VLARGAVAGLISNYTFAEGSSVGARCLEPNVRAALETQEMMLLGFDDGADNGQDVIGAAGFREQGSPVASRSLWVGEDSVCRMAVGGWIEIRTSTHTSLTHRYRSSIAHTTNAPSTPGNSPAIHDSWPSSVAAGSVSNLPRVISGDN